MIKSTVVPFRWCAICVMLLSDNSAVCPSLKGDAKMEKTLGKRIAELRKEKGLKQEVVAERLAVSPQAVSKWENDQTCPDISVLPLLAEILGVTVDKLLTGKDPTPIVQLASSEEKDFVLRMEIVAADGSVVRTNIPMSIANQYLSSDACSIVLTEAFQGQDLDLKSILSLAQFGVIGNLVEIQGSDGSTLRIYVE